MTLSRMAELLRLGNVNDWANAIEQLSYEMANDPDVTIGKITSLYGGMGSLNDIVLHKDRVPLMKENNEFATLKSKLFDLCHERRK